MPGLLAMLVTGSLLLAGAGQFWYLSGVLPSALYVNNYASILAGGTHLNLAFGHTWSLAVEEHFYLVWPLVLVAGHRRLGPRRLLVMTLALCLAALGYRALVAVTVTRHRSSSTSTACRGPTRSCTAAPPASQSARGGGHDPGSRSRR